MNERIVVVSVLNALVAVALAVILALLLTRGPETPQESASARARNGERAPRPEVPEVEEPPQLPIDAERLKEDLRERPELIPFDGELGGTMGFYDPQAIRVLSERWVYARFDDGHVQGEMLLEYTVGEDADIEWEVLEARLP